MTTTNYTVRSSYEAQTHELFDINCETNSDFYVVRKVFHAMWQASMPAERVEAIATAICGYNVGDLTQALESLVRMKILRRRSERGRKLYEVNYR